ncbi:MAG TPA: hypothetical protein VM847_07905, partial [Tahibacter sp.]|nr:hypothetical protein [Tahibacter sp.]
MKRSYGIGCGFRYPVRVDRRACRFAVAGADRCPTTRFLFTNEKGASNNVEAPRLRSGSSSNRRFVS